MTATDPSHRLDDAASMARGSGHAAGLPRQPLGADYGAYLARLLVLGATFAGAHLLNYLGGSRPYFVFLVIAGAILVCIGLLLGPQRQVRMARLAVPLLDLAWITYAMYLTDGLRSFVLPALYIVVALTAMRGNRWEIGTSVAGAITGIFILAGAAKAGPDFNLAVAHALLLAAVALTIRLTINAAAPTATVASNREFYEMLLRKTSDAVFALDPENWAILQANPAAHALCGSPPEEERVSALLPEVVRFTDESFLKACRQKLARGEPVVDAVTYARGASGHTLMLRCNMALMGETDGEVVQAIVEVVEDNQEEAIANGARRRDDFSVNYIPALTHELNNHLAAIRLSAELAATTGRMPDFGQMQQQVDQCQDVLQTVVLQILRAAAPTVTPGKMPEADLGAAVQRALLLTRPQVFTNGVHLQVEVPPHLPAVVGFSHELQEALARVIMQAVTNMVQQDALHSLALKASMRADRVEVLITDDGPGLDPRELAVIAGKQIAGSRVEDRTWEIVRDAVCRFGGELQAANGLHGGMRLRLDLPISNPRQAVA